MKEILFLKYSAHWLMVVPSYILYFLMKTTIINQVSFIFNNDNCYSLYQIISSIMLRFLADILSHLIRLSLFLPCTGGNEALELETGELLTMLL